MCVIIEKGERIYELWDEVIDRSDKFLRLKNLFI